VNANPTANRDAYLHELGARVRALRARRGLTRKAVALAADVSERHLANLELGSGNASVLVLQDVANALQCTLAELVGDITTSSPEWLMLRDMLAPLDDAALARVRVAAAQVLGHTPPASARGKRIALIGLRGAGKSTLGARLAQHLDCPFTELSHEVERLAGCSLNEIQALYGINAYRRYEHRALVNTIENNNAVVIATPGGLVSDPSAFNQLLSHCTTIWLQAKPEDHMHRVMAQGDTRPMQASPEAMEDLKSILAGRAAFYSKAQYTLDTSAQPLDETFEQLKAMVAQALPN
jgi:XRE family transcriptional regulator, aerobic/anaerobic benzoate catabolism transcriptional regulator